MKRRLFPILLLLALATLAALPAEAQRRRDPLTEEEVEQMREGAWNPNKRFELLITFARSRMLAIHQIRSDPKFIEGRGERVHELLGDFAAIVVELDRNIDHYAEQKLDMRKGLKKVVQVTAEWQLNVRELKEIAADPQHADETKEWKYVVEEAVDAVESVTENARATLAEQEDLAKQKLLRKPQPS